METGDSRLMQIGRVAGSNPGDTLLRPDDDNGATLLSSGLTKPRGVTGSSSPTVRRACSAERYVAPDPVGRARGGGGVSLVQSRSFSLSFFQLSSLTVLASPIGPLGGIRLPSFGRLIAVPPVGGPGTPRGYSGALRAVVG